MARTTLVTRLLLAGALALPVAASQAHADAPVSDAGEATCSVAPDLGADQADLVTQLQARLLAEQARSGEDVVVLNGRGYRYDDAPAIARDLRILEIEIARARARAKQAGAAAD